MLVSIGWWTKSFLIGKLLSNQTSIKKKLFGVPGIHFSIKFNPSTVGTSMTPCEPVPGCCQAAKCQGGRPAKETVTKFCYCVLRVFLQPTKSCLELVKKTDQNGISITDLTQKRKKPLGVFSNKRNSPFTVTATTVAVVPETSLDNNKFVKKKLKWKSAERCGCCNYINVQCFQIPLLGN